VTDDLLALLSLYGVPAMFAILAVSSAGVPFPITLLMVAAGSFVAQGEMKLWEVLVFGAAGATLGDQIGYWIGRKGGRRLVKWITDRAGGGASLERAEALNVRWGGAAVFLSRWMVTPLAPTINLTSGVSEYSWSKFFVWDLAGQIVWVAIFVNLGRIFSDRVQELSQLLGNVAWILVGVIVSILLGWKTVTYLRRPALSQAARPSTVIK